jgi:hypothetical protein
MLLQISVVDIRKSLLAAGFYWTYLACHLYSDPQCRHSLGCDYDHHPGAQLRLRTHQRLRRRARDDWKSCCLTKEIWDADSRLRITWYWVLSPVLALGGRFYMQATTASAPKADPKHIVSSRTHDVRNFHRLLYAGNNRLRLAFRGLYHYKSL